MTQGRHREGEMERRQDTRQRVSQVKLTTRTHAFEVSDLSMTGARVSDDGHLGEAGQSHVGALIVPGPEGPEPLPLTLSVVHRSGGVCGVRFTVASPTSLIPLARLLEEVKRAEALAAS